MKRDTNPIVLFALANGIAAGTTYVCLLVFAHLGSTKDLGLYAVIGAAVALFVSFIDSVCQQRVVQYAGDPPATFAPVRIAFMFMLLIPLSLITALWVGIFTPYSSLIVPGLLFLVGQVLYTTLTSSGAFFSPARLFVNQQIRAAGALLITNGGSILLFGPQFHITSMLATMGVARVVAGTVELVLGRKDPQRWKSAAPWSALATVLWARGERRRTARLMGRQAAIAAAGQVDTLGAALGGLPVVARYQLMQRPISALSVLNVSLDQYALRRAAAGRPLRARQIALGLMLLLVAWPLVGIAVTIIVTLLTPANLAPPLLGMILLSLAQALGGGASLAGATLLMRKRDGVLLAAALASLLGLICGVIVLAPSFGANGIAGAVLLSRILVLAIYSIGLARYGAPPTNPDEMKL